MTDLLYNLVYHTAQIHDWILTWNDSSGYFFDDKQLHFIVMGVVGMGVFLLSYFLFKLLQDHIVVVAAIYAFTVMFVLTFAIEIGQGFTGTGAMEMDDVRAGIAGFLFLLIIFLAIRGVFLGILHLFTKKR